MIPRRRNTAFALAFAFLAVIPEGNLRFACSGKALQATRARLRSVAFAFVFVFVFVFAILVSTAAENLLYAEAPAPQAISGQYVLHLTQQFLTAAPKRFNGSPGHLAAQTFIKSQFAPEAAKGNLVTDNFIAMTPAGAQSMQNLVVKFPGKRDGIIVLATHYETNYNLKDINFVGANDGACTSALLIAIGQYLRTHPPDGYSVWLLFDDGEESVSGQWSEADQLYGTRHIAAKWSGDGTLKQIKAFLLADMIGWKQMKIDREGASTPWLLDDLAIAAKQTGHSNVISKTGQPLTDDHIPFKERGVPVLDVVDFEYGTPADPEAYHHTIEDTFDKLSAASLQASADIFLALIRLVNQH